MTVTNIPDDHHFVRQCKHSQYFTHNGKIKPYPEAFHLRDATPSQPEERVLSGVYYEWFDGNPSEKLQASFHFINITIKPKDALLKLNAGLIRQQGLSRSLKLRVRHEPEPACWAYAGVRGLPKPPDHELCALLATLCLIEAVDAATINGP